MNSRLLSLIPGCEILRQGDSDDHDWSSNILDDAIRDASNVVRFGVRLTLISENHEFGIDFVAIPDYLLGRAAVTTSRHDLQTE